jgi:hypothetical protein
MHTDVRSSYRPRLFLRLYELEADDTCRLVREVMNVLDPHYVCLPSPAMPKET